MIDRVHDSDEQHDDEASPPLEQVLADARGEAAVLRSHGHVAQAKTLELFADRVGTSMRSYLNTLSESEAALRSGWTPTRLRGRFAEWQSSDFAMLDKRGNRRYRECIVPVRTDRSAARLAGERGESLKAVGGSNG
jgi:hypothetical protein